MMLSKVLLKEKKWSFLLILFILFFNPFFYPWAKNLNAIDQVYNMGVCLCVWVALCSITLFLKNRSEKIFLTILFVLSLAPNVIVWSYLLISDTYMNQELFWVIFDSNPGESKEYFEGFIPWETFVGAGIYIFCGLFLLIKSKSSEALQLKRYKYLFIISIVLLFSVFYFSTKQVSMFDFYKSAFSYMRESRKVKNHAMLRKHADIKVDCSLKKSNKHVFVVVIGESLSRDHFQLNGYFRETTPLLALKKDELDIYSDAVSCGTYTISVLKKVLTFADNQYPENYIQKPSVIELFNMAGFETYWISNQDFVSKWGGSYGAVAEQAEHIDDLHMQKQHDGIVLSYLNEALKNTIDKDKLIFIHLMGSHHAYDCRYPKEFDYFDFHKNPLPEKPFLDDNKRKIIDEYDNSVRYTDFVVNSIIEQVDSINKSSFVLFFSDHGEEVYETRDVCGHFISNVYPSQCRIPFILWRSSLYKEERPDLVINTSRPFSNENLIYGLSDLSGLQYKDYNPSLSLFSPEYTPPEKRMVGDEDYDRTILKK